MTESTGPIRIETKGSIKTITLAEPARRNALSSALIGALHGALKATAKDTAVRVVILAAEGPVFSAGHDLKELSGARNVIDGGRAEFDRVFKSCADLMKAIVHLPQPVIAEVQGLATAAGCQLAASCDLVVAAETASFATPGVDIGLFCSSPMVALSRAAGAKPVMEMLLTGEAIGAARAREIGLVNRVVLPERLKDETLALARKIAAKPPTVIGMGKAAFHKQRGQDLHAAYETATRVMSVNMLMGEAREGINAFLEKRPPRWSV